MGHFIILNGSLLFQVYGIYEVFIVIRNMFDLRGKTIIITGGAGHLGSGMSEALAAFGANLFILGTDLEKNQRKAKELKKIYNLSICESLKFNIKDEILIHQAIDKIFEITGQIDVLINNASYGCMKPLEDYSYEEWFQGIDGTINGVFRITQAVLRYMREKKQGNIINISSMYGMVAPDMRIYGDSKQNNPANYGAGKAAIIQFTKYVASVYAGEGIRSNAISPGPFPNRTVQKDERFICELCGKNPMNRIGTPEDLQGIIVFLASDASKYMTGQNIAVDGGWTIW